MKKEQVEKLLPYFAYKYSKQLNPEKYGEVSMEEWANLIGQNPEDEKAIVEAAKALTEEDWSALDKEYSSMVQESSSPQFAEKGAKLEYLKKLKTKQSKPVAKKCSCGCDLIEKKDKGGKIISTCSCGCKAQMKEEGGGIDHPADTKKKLDAATKVFKIFQKMQLLKAKP